MYDIAKTALNSMHNIIVITQKAGSTIKISRKLKKI